jgi:hypothetical protein
MAQQDEIKYGLIMVPHAKRKEKKPDLAKQNV